MQHTKKILNDLNYSRYEHSLNQFARLDEQAFLQQVKDFDTLDYENMNKFFKLISIVDSSHPWTVMRAAELIKWIEQGDYDVFVCNKRD